MHEEIELESQEIAAEIRSIRSVIDHSVPLVIIIFLGQWSDSHGRKFPILVASLTPVVQAVALIICVHLKDLDGYAVGLTASISRSLCGAEVVFGMGAYSYLADRTTAAARTIRIGLLSAGYNLGVPIGSAVAGAVTSANLGYTINFSISAAIGLAGVLIVLFTVDNKVINPPDEEKENGCFTNVASAFKKFLGYIKVLFKNRDGYDRAKILLLVIAFIGTQAPIHGKNSSIIALIITLKSSYS
jgi:MFS family permease